MKFHLTFVFNGNESINEKLLKKVKENENLKRDFVYGLMSMIGLAFEINNKDCAVPENLQLGKINDPLDD